MTKGARFSIHRSGAALLLSAAVGLTFAGCSATPPDDTTKPPGFSDISVVPGAAKLDSARESITLPIDAYSMSVLEGSVIDYAMLLLQKDCMSKQGVGFVVVKPYGSLNDPSGGNYEGGATPNHIWGLWDIATAAKWGYSTPPDALREQRLAANSQQMTASQSAIADGCFREVKSGKGVSVEKLLGSGATITYRAQFHTYPEDTKGGKAAYGGWVSCIKKAGLVPDKDNAFLPAGALTLEQGEQIRVAIADATCKQSSGLIQQLSDIEAAYQKVYIAKNETALIEWRKKIQVAVDHAKEIIHASEG